MTIMYAPTIRAMAEFVGGLSCENYGGALPPVPELVEELTAPVYFFHGDRMQIEDKEQIKAKIGRSPDFADALALTFAHPVRAVDRRLSGSLGRPTHARMGA